ncbi:MAG: 30S ribosomal protein S12 methylthiotransferase RimO [Negativicutes bacterium]
MKIGLVSLGCSKNLVDSELMLGLLREHQYESSDDPAEAEVLIVNSCGFIESAKTESIETLLRLAEYKKTGRCRALILAGCLGQRYGGNLMTELPEVDAIVGTGAWNRLPEAILAALDGKRSNFTEGSAILPTADMPRILSTPAHWAYVKIAEGCNHTCAFCAIPQIRGPLVSRTIESLQHEVAGLVFGGVKEINLVAQDTTSYGIDLYGRPMLLDLLKVLTAIEGHFRIRILYSYPKHFTNDLIEFIGADPKICNYVDIPLQHVHDDLLRSMRRPDRRADIERLIDKLRAVMPDIAIRTTFIVGLPGESEKHYQELRTFVEEKRIDHVGVFQYSAEEGTDAAGFGDQISEEVKEERYNDLMAVQAGISEEINRAAEGRSYEALIEGHDTEDSTLGYGRTEREAPDIDGTVYIENAGDVAVGEFVSVRILQGFCYDRMAEVII